MNNNYLEKLYHTNIPNIKLEDLPIGLFNGKMGLCMFYYMSEEEKDRKFAHQLLEDIYLCVNNETYDIDFKNGISGIAWGLIILVKNKCIDGDINAVLHEIDDFIYNQIIFDWLVDNTKQKDDFVWLLVYYTERLPHIQDYDERIIIKKIIIAIINHIEDTFQNVTYRITKNFAVENFIESIYAYALLEFYKQNIYKNKIIKILENLTKQLTINFNDCQANIFINIITIKEIGKYFKLSENVYNNLEIINCDLEKIIKNNFKNRNIHLYDGLTGFILLVYTFDRTLLTENIINGVLNKIEKSFVWKDIVEPSNVSLYKGYTGILFIWRLLRKIKNI
ncbi:MAG: hypothetical protein IJZ42_12995 [Lachnospiraceae bacterium]|nr:hypothetical protein [Lachnospiraceae bacterium]